MMGHKNTWRRKLETEEVYGSSTPVLRGSRKGRVRLVQEFGERWLNQCSYPHVVVLSFCHLSCKLDTFPVFRLPPYVVFGADGNGAWDDDDAYYWFCRLHLLFRWRKEGEERERERDGFSWNCKENCIQHTSLLPLIHGISVTQEKGIMNSIPIRRRDWKGDFMIKK